MKKIFLFISFCTVALSVVSCDKYLDIKPEGIIIPKTVEDFRKLMTSGYSTYPKHKSLSTVRTDESTIRPSENTEYAVVKDIFMFNDFSYDTQTKEFGYDQFYKCIFYANQTIIGGSTTMQVGDEREQLVGEAYALRAMSYFDLTNLYAKPYNKTSANTELAIVLQNTLDIENRHAKSTMAEVYNQIHSDIDNAKKHLRVNSFEIGKNYRFTKAAIYALEARVNLYQKEYEASLASVEQALIYKNQLQDLTTPGGQTTSVASFKSVESILALEEVYISNLNAISFVSEDLLKTFDTKNDLRYATTFDVDGGKKDVKVKKTGNGEMKASFRTAELYMTKAEAQAQLGQLSDAKATLNQLITKRYTAEGVAAINTKIATFNQDELIQFILDERFKEFAFEGHRWFDLRRANQKEIVHVLDGKQYILQKGDPRYTLPFPKKARENNPNL